MSSCDDVGGCVQVGGNAVGCGEHELAVEQGSAALAAPVDQHLPGVGVGWVLNLATNNSARSCKIGFRIYFTMVVVAKRFAYQLTYLTLH